MSVTSGYFFNYDGSLEQIAVKLNNALGLSLAPYDGDSQDWFCRYFGLEFSLLRAEDFDDDGELDFTNYRYRLATRTCGTDRLRDVQCEAMGIVAYAMWERLQITGMLVWNMDTLMARYEERTGEDGYAFLFDRVGDGRVRFPEHFRALRARLLPD